MFQTHKKGKKIHSSHHPKKKKGEKGGEKGLEVPTPAPAFEVPQKRPAFLTRFSEEKKVFSLITTGGRRAKLLALSGKCWGKGSFF